MTAAYDYEDLHHLVDRLTPAQVRRLRVLVDQDADLAGATPPAAVGPDHFFSLIGSIDGPADLAEHHDSYVRERMGGRLPLPL